MTLEEHLIYNLLIMILILLSSLVALDLLERIYKWIRKNLFDLDT